MQRILRQDAMEYEFNYNHDPKLNCLLYTSDAADE